MVNHSSYRDRLIAVSLHKWSISSDKGLHNKASAASEDMNMSLKYIIPQREDSW